jgi:hypothetical protein
VIVGQGQGVGGFDRKDEPLGHSPGIVLDRGPFGKLHPRREQAVEPLVDLDAVQGSGVVGEIVLGAVGLVGVVEQTLPGAKFLEDVPIRSRES